MFNRDDPRRIINYRPLLFAAVGMIMGIAALDAYLSLDLPYALAIAVPVCALAVICVFCVFCVLKKRSALVILIVFFMIGAVRTALAQPKPFVEGEHTVVGVVDEISEKNAGVVFLRSVQLDEVSLGGRMKVTVKGTEKLPAIGDRITFIGAVKKPSIRFGTYDERVHLLSSGVHAKASCIGFETVSSGELPIKSFFSNTRAFLRDRIETVFAENGDIVSGFLLGVKSGIDEADIESFRATGTAHLLTLSGLHVGLLTSAIMLLLPKRYPKLRFGIVGSFLLLYCGVSDFAPSIVRASLMCGCYLLADVFERRRDTLSSLSLAAVIILLFSPYMIRSVGFRLSFAATLGIVLFNSAGEIRSEKPVLRRFVSAAVMTLGATAGTMLISAQCFGVFPVYGLIANVIAVPLFSLAVVMCFAVLLFGLIFPGAASLLAWVPNRIIDGTMLILEKIGNLPYSCIDVIPPSTLSGVLMLVMMFCISAYVLRPLGKRLKIASLVFVLFTASIAADIIRA